MDVADFDFELPEELIAQEPSPERGGSRLLVLSREHGNVQDVMFRDLGLFQFRCDVRSTKAWAGASMSINSRR